MQCNCYKHPILRGSAGRHWPETPARAWHVSWWSSWGDRLAISGREKKKKTTLGYESNRQSHLHTHKPLPNQPILAPDWHTKSPFLHPLS